MIGALPAGQQAGLPLPYRSQARAAMPPAEELEAVPEGACRSVLMRSRMLRSLCTTEETLPHCGLGLPGYVQVTSPIRRYTDLLAHWQLKVTAAPRLHVVWLCPRLHRLSALYLDALRLLAQQCNVSLPRPCQWLLDVTPA